MEKCWRDDEVKTLDTGSPLITTPSLSALAYSTGFYFRLVDTYRYESRSKRFIQDILKFFIPNIFNRMTFILQWNEKNQNCIIIEIFFFILICNAIQKDESNKKLQSCEPCCAWLATFQLVVISGLSRSIDMTIW